MQDTTARAVVVEQMSHICTISVHALPGAVAYRNAYFGSGSGPYHLANVYCSGSESSLLSCRRGYSIGVHNCRPGRAAGVKCAGSKCVVPMCTTIDIWQEHIRTGS